jgi:hypothetical protein
MDSQQLREILGVVKRLEVRVDALLQHAALTQMLPSRLLSELQATHSGPWQMKAFGNAVSDGHVFGIDPNTKQVVIWDVDSAPTIIRGSEYWLYEVLGNSDFPFSPVFRLKNHLTGHYLRMGTGNTEVNDMFCDGGPGDLTVHQPVLHQTGVPCYVRVLNGSSPGCSFWWTGGHKMTATVAHGSAGYGGVQTGWPSDAANKFVFVA